MEFGKIERHEKHGLEDVKVERFISQLREVLILWNEFKLAFIAGILYLAANQHS